MSYLIAIQRSFALTLPVIMVGTVALLLRYPPVQALQSWYSPTFVDFCDSLIFGTFGIASLIVLVGFSITFTKLHIARHGERHANTALTTMVVLACFFIASRGSLTEALSIGNGLLGALLIATVSGVVFLKLSGFSKLRIPLGALGTDPLIGDVFLLMPAAVLTIFSFATGHFLIGQLTGPDVELTFGNWLADFLGGREQGLSFALVYEGLAQTFWFLGFHGPNTLFAAYDVVTHPNTLANFEAIEAGLEPQAILTSQFFDFFVRMGGSGSTLCLIAAVLIKGQSSDHRKLALLALIPGIFNVNEPLIFGLPIVLNPVYFIPFLVTPLVQICTSYAAMALDLLPSTSFSPTWTTPVLFSGYLSTGSPAGAALQLVNLAIGIAIYIPFVGAAERMARGRSRRLIDQLMTSSDEHASGKNQTHYLRRPGPEARVAISIAHDLEKALNTRTGLYLEYQAQVDTESWQLSGAEALLRWNHPTFGPIAPPLIVGLAEEMGRLDDLGMFVLREACRQRSAWSSWLPADFSISVNVAPEQLSEPHFAENVLNILSEARLTPKQIELEVTESSSLLPHRSSVQALCLLRNAGFSIALDDFGMGHTSIHYLRELPLDKIKIDRSITVAAASHANDLIVKSILELGQSLGITILTEGVEHESQLEHFMGLGCKHYQGFLFSRPLGTDAFRSFAQPLISEERNVLSIKGQSYRPPVPA